MLETKQLKIFTTIVEAGSFTRAGRRLNLSQPAISQQIRGLEEQLGVQLLVRTGKHARPAPSGELLLQCAHHVLEKLDEIQRMVSEHQEGGIGRLRIGSGDAACRRLLPSILKELSRRYPRVHVQMTTGHSTATASPTGISTSAS